MVGEKLRQAREAKNLTIKDAEKGTSIRALYIEAIEKGDYKVLPGEAYLKGFIKSYANFLGLDGKDLVDEYKAEQGEAVAVEVAAEDAAATENQSGEKSAQVRDYAAKNDTKPRSYGNLNDNSSNGLMKKAIIGLGILVVLGGAYAAFSGDEEPAKQNAVKTEVAAKEPAKTAQPAETKPAPVNEIDLEVKLTDRCWMQVEVDKRVVYEGTANSGEKLSWKGKDNIKITAGNAGAVEFIQNGKDLGKLGNTGEVINREFTKNGLVPVTEAKPAETKPTEAKQTDTKAADKDNKKK